MRARVVKLGSITNYIRSKLVSVANYHRLNFSVGIENPPAETGIDRPIALTMHVVIASLSPKGLPIAITVSATSTFEEFANASGLREDNSCR